MNDYKEMMKKYSFHWALGGTDTSGGLEQNSEELEQLCRFIDEKDILTYLEIGIAHGRLLSFMTREMRLIGKGITLDKMDGHDGLNVIYGRSQSNKIKQEFEGCRFDLIFVDGDHSYGGVSSDYENFKDKCKYMAFHDILGLRQCEGVKQFWKEIKKEYEGRYWEFIGGTNPSGIGVLKIK